MKKKICIAIAMLLTCTSVLLIQHKEPNVGATSIDQMIFCFLSYNPNEAWEISPEGMLCNGYDWAITTIDGDVERLTESCSSGMGPDTIIKVELRTKGFYYLWGDDRDIILRPVFPSGDGDNHTFDTPWWHPDWSEWFDITNDTNAPLTWTFEDVATLDCDVEAENNPLGSWFILFCHRVEIRVTYQT